METENYPAHDINQSVNKTKENFCGAVNHSGENYMVNGISNGIGEKIKSKERDENRDKHREKHKDHKDKHRDKDKYKDRDHKHSSSSEHRSKEKHSSSSKDKEKDRERHKDKERDGHREKESKHRDEKREKEHKSSSSSHKDKEKRDDKRSISPSKHNSSSSKSHSSSKDKEKHNSSSSSRDKERSEKDRSDRDKSEKDKHRSDKEKSRHSSDKSKHSSSRDKEKREKDREKEYKEEKVKYEKENEKERVKRQILQDDEDEEVPEFEKDLKSEPLFSEPELEDIKTEPEEIQNEAEDSFFSQMDSTQEDEDQLYIKTEDGSDDDDIPLSERSKVKREASDDEDDIPLSARKKPKKEKKKRKMESEDEGEEEDYKPVKKKPTKKPKVKEEQISREESSPKKKKKQEEDHEVWKWWEEEKKPDGVKWNYLEHKGPVFAPAYEPLPPNVKFFYDGDEMKLSEETEEVATFYAKMLDHDYTTKEAFNKNFFKDWRKVMTSKEKETITDLRKCNFKQMHAYFQQKSEERKAMTKEEKKVIKEQNEELLNEYGFCVIDGHKEKIGNFKIEPPGLFRGRGEHPKMGMLKRRVMPEDVLINCSKGSKIPEPPPGHKWKEIRHDNTVTWLASWTENVQGQVKYVMLNPSSKLKGEKDMQKYETARKLAKSIDKIRKEYREDWKSKEMRIRQRAVALYFIDILALRAGNEKDEDQADTVGCCSLRVEHITLHTEKDGKEFVVTFDFLGKDSIRYYNEIPVEKRVFKNLQLFMEGKKGNDDLFDRLNTTILNKHLNELMEGLTAKVFRTYNASWTLQQQLKELTDPSHSIPEMILTYNRANRAVAILCNHQRSIPKSHQKSMDNLKGKIQAKREAVDEAEKQYKQAKRDAKNGSAKERIVADKAKKKVERLREQLNRLEVQETDREENKTIALGTSKLNYLDPRISVAWCKKFNVPIEKVYNKTQRQKFRWAIDMAGPDFVF